MKLIGFTILMFVLVNASHMFSQQLKNTALFEGKEVFVHKINNIYTKTGVNYIVIDEKAYVLYSRERARRGPVQLEHYIKINEDSIFSITNAFLKESLGQKKFNAVKHTLDRYPDSKPSLKYTTKSGKIIKYYDIKKTRDGSIISEEEFQSFRGNYIFLSRIDGGAFAMDTILIKPPSSRMKSKERDRIDNFNAQIGKKAPTFEIKGIDGKLYSNHNLLGKTVVINFWFASCAPCKKEMPELNKIFQNYTKEDIVFLGLSTDDEMKAKKFLASNDFTYSIAPNALDIAEKFQVKFYPTNIVINKKGIITYVSSDYNAKKIKALEQAIKSAID